MLHSTLRSHYDKLDYLIWVDLGSLVSFHTYVMKMWNFEIEGAVFPGNEPVSRDP